MKAKDVKYFIIHCSDTPDTRDIGVKEIRRIHIRRRFRDVGYHYIIRRDGTLEDGRPVRIAGAHCIGNNGKSIGICLVGRNEFDMRQYMTLRDLVEVLAEKYPGAKAKPHNWFPSAKRQGKTCPNFNIGSVLPKKLIF